MFALSLPPDGPVAPCPVEIDSDMGDILYAVVAEIEAFGAVDPVDIETSISSFYPEMRTIGVPYQPSVWFSRLPPAQRKRYSRATRRLERSVYLDRILERRRERVTHVRPTFAGLDWVIASAGTVNLADLAEGLRRCEWASELHRQFLVFFPGAA